MSPTRTWMSPTRTPSVPSVERNERDYDVVVVGAGIGGCAAAIGFARQGSRVALLERKPDPHSHKAVCTHLIQSSAVPALERLGLAEHLLAAGAVRSNPEAWTNWGWIRPPAPAPDRPQHNLNIRRETLDPLLRELAISTPGVEFRLGETVDGVLRDGVRIAGVVARSRGGETTEFRARLTVAADGRSSSVARFANRPGRVLPHRRSSFWAYYEGLRLDDPGRFRLWFLDPEFAAAFPTDGGHALVACMVDRDRAPAFKRDLEANFVRLIESLPEAPPIREAIRVTKIMGKLDMPNVWRPAAGRGLAFVGDAAMATDPLNAVGCGWAAQSAEWLVQEAGPAIVAGDRLEPALRRYRRRHRRLLLGHHLVNANYATGRRFNPLERLILSSATRDDRMAAHFEAYGSRNIGVSEFVAPRALARAAAVNLRHRFVPPAARANVASKTTPSSVT